MFDTFLPCISDISILSLDPKSFLRRILLLWKSVASYPLTELNFYYLIKFDTSIIYNLTEHAGKCAGDIVWPNSSAMYVRYHKFRRQHREETALNTEIINWPWSSTALAHNKSLLRSRLVRNLKSLSYVCTWHYIARLLAGGVWAGGRWGMRKVECREGWWVGAA